MAGNVLPIQSKIKASVQNAPDVGVVVKFNGQSLPAILTLGEAQELQFGNFTVSVEAVDLVPKPEHEVTTWLWTIKGKPFGDRTVAVREYLCMKREEATDQWEAEFPNTKPQKVSQSLPPSA
jgi:hypothetical protein